MKISKSIESKFLMELKHFYPLMSLYLPAEELVANINLRNWMQNTPNLTNQFVSEIEYNLPAPRH
jgi:hypothetical protein